jgi:hypothetical protein
MSLPVPDGTSRVHDQVRTEVDHAIATHDDERVGLGRDGGLRHLDEVLVAGLAETRDFVSEGAEPLDHRRPDTLRRAKSCGRVDRDHESLRLRHDLIMVPRCRR